MTDVLPPLTSRPPLSGSRDDGEGRRPLVVGAVLAGLAAPLTVLTVCLAVALVGWFASDGGTHGSTRDALRVGADGWLLAHLVPLDVGVATITAAPLGLTLLCGYVAFRFGRWAALTSAPADLRMLGLGAAVLCGTYAAVAVVVAVLASVPSVQPSLDAAVLGGLLVATLGGGLGLLVGSGRFAAIRGRVPEHVPAVGRGALSVVLMMFAAGSVLFVAGLLADFGTAANIFAGLHPDVAGGLLYTLLVAAVAPNVSLLGASYLLGPGFAFGAGTLVSPAETVLGPMPAIPILAALPADGPGPGWVTILLGVPAVLAAVAAALAARVHPVDRLGSAAWRGLASGVLGALLLALAIAQAGGAIGPGRMGDIGAPFSEVLLTGALTMGLGGLVGSTLMAAWQRRSVGR